MAQRLHLRAEWVLPVGSPPIPDGEVIAEGAEIVEVRSRRMDGSPTNGVRDLGQAVVMPGLVNVHAHVEYTILRGLLDGLPFFEWIRALTALKSRCETDDWIASATVGAAEAVASGTTTIADCTDSGAALDGLLALGARGLVYQEAFGIGEDVPVDEAIHDLKARVAELARRAEPGLHRVGISPHSPYTVRPALLRSIAAYGDEDGLPICIHAAESHAEVELVRRGTGTIADSLAARGIAWHPPGSSVVTYLHDLGLLTSRTLLVHGVQVSSSDRAIIAQSGAAWAHCPRSNARLGVGVAPLRWMRTCGRPGPPRVGLGTDSVVSAGTMDMFEEMRFALMIQRALGRNPAKPSAGDVLEMATIGGARALGMEHSIGSLREGALADIVAISVRDRRYSPMHDPVQAVVFAGNARDVMMTVIAGTPVYEKGRLAGHGLRAAHSRLRRATAKVRSLPEPGA